MDILKTQRLIIRPFSMDDLHQAHQLLDVELEWSGPSFTLDQRRERLQFYIGLAQWQDTQQLYGFRALTLRESGLLIGICGFHPDLWSSKWKSIFWPQLFADYEPAHDNCASLELGIGYALSPSARGQGYATEAVKAFLAHAFQVIQIKRVFAVTDNANVDSLKVMQRANMRIARNPDSNVVYPSIVGVCEINKNDLPTTQVVFTDN